MTEKDMAVFYLTVIHVLLFVLSVYTFGWYGALVLAVGLLGLFLVIGASGTKEKRKNG